MRVHLLLKAADSDPESEADKGQAPAIAILNLLNGTIKLLALNSDDVYETRSPITFEDKGYTLSAEQLDIETDNYLPALGHVPRDGPHDPTATQRRGVAGGQGEASRLSQARAGAYSGTEVEAPA